MPRTPHKSHTTIHCVNHDDINSALSPLWEFFRKNLKKLIHATPKKGKRCNNPKSPFLWLCSALTWFPSVFLFLPMATSEQTKTQPLFQALYNLFAIKHVEKRKRHVTKTHLVVERELLVVLLHFQVTTLAFRLPRRPSCFTTDVTRRCAADSAAPSGSASSPCRTGWTRCLRKNRQHCVGANDAFGNFGRKNRCGSGKTYRCVSAARISFLSNARIGGAILIIWVTLLRSKRVHVDAMLSSH